MRWLIWVVTISFLSGCGGKIVTVYNPQPVEGGNSEQGKPATYEGVFAYEKKLVKVPYKFTKLEIEGKTVGKGPEVCEIVETVEYETRPNYTKKFLVRFVPGFFAKYDFSVSYSDGSITSINGKSESQIPETLNAVTGFIKELKTPGVASTPPTTEKILPDCNSGKRSAGKEEDVNP